MGSPIDRNQVGPVQPAHVQQTAAVPAKGEMPGGQKVTKFSDLSLKDMFKAIFHHLSKFFSKNYAEQSTDFRNIFKELKHNYDNTVKNSTSESQLKNLGHNKDVFEKLLTKAKGPYLKQDIKEILDQIKVAQGKLSPQAKPSATKVAVPKNIEQHVKAKSEARRFAKAMEAPVIKKTQQAQEPAKTLSPLPANATAADKAKRFSEMMGLPARAATSPEPTTAAKKEEPTTPAEKTHTPTPQEHTARQKKPGLGDIYKQKYDNERNDAAEEKRRTEQFQARQHKPAETPAETPAAESRRPAIREGVRQHKTKPMKFEAPGKGKVGKEEDIHASDEDIAKVEANLNKLHMQKIDTKPLFTDETKQKVAGRLAELDRAGLANKASEARNAEAFDKLTDLISDAEKTVLNPALRRTGPAALLLSSAKQNTLHNFYIKYATDYDKPHIANTLEARKELKAALALVEEGFKYNPKVVTPDLAARLAEIKKLVS